jgi:hypothetical protein
MERSNPGQWIATAALLLFFWFFLVGVHYKTCARHGFEFMVPQAYHRVNGGYYPGCRERRFPDKWDISLLRRQFLSLRVRLSISFRLLYFVRMDDRAKRSRHFRPC